MTSSTLTVVDKVRAALASEPRVRLHEFPIGIACDGDELTLEGETASIAGKKLALERAAAAPGVATIIDRPHVQPAARMADGEIRDLVCRALLQESAFAEVTLLAWKKGGAVVVQQPAERQLGSIEVRVADGVVTLGGEVPSLAHKRLAGVLAWWVPGSRDVTNGLAVEPAEADSDDEITEAVRVALEKDPFVDAAQVRVRTHDCVVTLDGLVPTDSEREMAEFDAWYVFGVDNVINRIEVRA